MTLKLTNKQFEAVRLMKSEATYVLLQGGSRSGKTSFCVYLCLHTALSFANSRILISRLYLSELRASIIEDTLPKIATLLSPDLNKFIRNNMNKQYNYINFPNGSSIWFDGISDARRSEKILGREYNLIYLNEITQIDYEAFQKLITRLALCTAKKYRNRIIADCNPTSKSFWAYKLFIENIDPIDKKLRNSNEYATLVMNPTDNPHLSKHYLQNVLSNLTERQRQRFEQGKWLDDIEGALWKQSAIDSLRCPIIPLESFKRIVIGVDPAVSENEQNSAETGIVACGKINDKEYCVIADKSGVYSPNSWAKIVVDLYNDLKADIIIAETNQGGNLVLSNITRVSRLVRIKKVHAKTGKKLRAEPVVGLYERGEVKHMKIFNKLEEQMTTWVPFKSDSPDRVDALVYALTELSKITSQPFIKML